VLDTFFKIYTKLYILFLQIRYANRIKIRGKVKAKRFFRIELSRGSQLEINGTIDIKENVLIAARKNAVIIIGKDVFFNRNCSIVARGTIVIEDECMFGENVKIYDNDHLVKDGKIFSNQYNIKQVHIKKGSWIANDVNILKGSVIPQQSVIAAMSLVNLELNEPGIYAGIPVKLKKRIG